MGGEGAADERTDDGGDTEESAKEALNTRTVLERHSVDDANNLGMSAVAVYQEVGKSLKTHAAGEDARGTDALDGAPNDEGG